MAKEPSVKCPVNKSRTVIATTQRKHLQKGQQVFLAKYPVNETELGAPSTHEPCPGS